MRIHVIGINYWPEATGISVFSTGRAEYLAAQGHDVTMCTAMPYYPQWRIPDQYRGFRFRNEERGGVRILRCPLYVPSAVTALRRVLHEASFVAAAFVRSLFCRRPDILVVVSPPLGLAIVAAILARVWRVPYVFHVADLQPDTALDLGMVQRGFVARLLYAVERLAYSRAALVSTLTPAMRTRIIAKGIPADRVTLFSDWADPDLFDLSAGASAAAIRAELKLDDRFVVLHIGNMGVKQGLGVVLDAAERTRDDYGIVYVLVGDGAARPQLEAAARARALPNVRFLPLLPHDRFLALLASADACLVTQQRTVADVVFPSKTLTLFAAGKAVIASVTRDSEVARVVDEAGAGLVVAPEDGAALADAVMRLRRDVDLHAAAAIGSRRFARRSWDRTATLKHLDDMLRRTAAARPRDSRQSGASTSDAAVSP
jgi:putative colanic acid biosynthesis glycosyltransferase WcaI